MPIFFKKSKIFSKKFEMGGLWRIGPNLEDHGSRQGVFCNFVK